MYPYVFSLFMPHKVGSKSEIEMNWLTDKQQKKEIKQSRMCICLKHSLGKIYQEAVIAKSSQGL